MGSPIGVLSEREAKGLTKKQRADLRTYYIGTLVSSKDVIKIAKKNPHLLLQIGEVAKNPNSLPALMKKNENIRRKLKVAARPMIEKMKKK